MTNHEYLKSLEPFEFAKVINDIAENQCDCCPRRSQDSCNEDCDNGITEWLVSEYLGVTK